MDPSNSFDWTTSRGVLAVTWFVSGGLLEAVTADLGDSSAVTAGVSRGI